MIAALSPAYQKLKGNLPAGLEQILDRIFKVELPWEEIFEKVLGTKFEIVESKRWNYPNIYYRNVRYLPANDVEEKIDTVAIFIDTSGSISGDDLRKFFGVVLDLIEKNNISNVVVVQHDYELQKIDVIEADMIDNEESLLENIKIKGRGGTSHVIPWQEFEKLIDAEEVPLPDFTIFLSDFYSDFEKLIEKLKKEYWDFFCVVTNDGNVLNEFEKGEYIKIK